MMTNGGSTRRTESCWPSQSERPDCSEASDSAKPPPFFLKKIKRITVRWWLKVRTRLAPKRMTMPQSIRRCTYDQLSRASTGSSAPVSGRKIKWNKETKEWRRFRLEVGPTWSTAEAPEIQSGRKDEHQDDDGHDRRRIVHFPNEAK